MKHVLVFDIETNGLYNEVTKTHCINIWDSETGKHYRYDKDNEPIFKGIEHLNDTSKLLVGHNIVGYDLPVLRKLYPKFKWKHRDVYDTFIGSKLIFTDLETTDMGRIVSGKLPKKLFKRHSLEAWGYRMGDYKGDYGQKEVDEDEETYQERVWAEYSKEMADYCEQDVRVTKKLYEYQLQRIDELKIPRSAIDIEHNFARIISRQERHGVVFDYDRAVELEKELRIKSSESLEKCLAVYKPKWFLRGQHDKNIIIEGQTYKCKEAKVNRREKFEKPNGEIITVTGKLKGCLFTNIELREFNPNSGNHIIRWLTEDWGWEPSEFTDKGNPKTDADTLSTLKFEGVETLQYHQMIEKRLSQLADGKGSLLNKYNPETGRVYGRVDTLGAVSRRCTHSSPNLAQVPNNSAPYGETFRSLFSKPEGYKLVGADAKGLELRTLSHYLYIYDGGSYGEEVVKGDVHTRNQIGAGLPTRDDAKTFIYAFLYGAGDAKIGEIVAPRGTLAEKKRQGKSIKDKFKKSNKDFAKLTEEVISRAKRRGYIIDKDGKKLYTRSTHSALNLLLQSCGAIVMKYIAVEIDNRLQELGYLNTDDILHTNIETYDYEFVLNIHDEVQMEVIEHIIDEVSTEILESFPYIGKVLKMNVLIEGDCKVGNTWKETH